MLGGPPVKKNCDSRCYCYFGSSFFGAPATIGGMYALKCMRCRPVAFKVELLHCVAETYILYRFAKGFFSTHKNNSTV